MSTLLEIPGKPKPQFEFGGASLLGQRLQNKQNLLCIMTGIENGWLKKLLLELIPLVTDLRPTYILRPVFLSYGDVGSSDV